MDMYLIIDGSSSLQNSKSDVLAWINEQVIDRILTGGDSITIWAAGNRPESIYSATLPDNTAKQAVKDRLASLNTTGNNADFSGALREAAARVSQTSRDRLAITMLITASAEVIEPAITGSGQGLLRWFRSEKYERWQVLIVGTEIGSKVRQAAASYMSSRR
ncbi:MAG: VWA domain-containing protein [Treponema sp.]|nr:VWA domain-containing protein [Treponema sp.]